MNLGSPVIHKNYRPELMTYARLGKTDIMASRISMGGYNNDENKQNAHYNADADPAAYKNTLHYLLDNGVNLFDTAPDYNTETYFGEVFGNKETRNNVAIITKIDRLVKDLKTGKPFTIDQMRDYIRSGLTGSLKRLKTGYVDLLLLHHLNDKGDSPYHNLGFVGPDYDHFKMAYDAINELIGEGLVKYKGFTSHYPDITRDAVLLPGYTGETDVVIAKYTITKNFFQGQEPSVWENETFPVLKEHDVGVLQMKALLSPHHTLEEKIRLIEDDNQALSRIKPFLDQGYSYPQAMIKWGLSNDTVHSCLIGMSRIHFAKENLDAVRPDT